MHWNARYGGNSIVEIIAVKAGGILLNNAGKSKYV